MKRADYDFQDDEQTSEILDAITRLESEVQHMEENQERILSNIRKRRIIFFAILTIGVLSSLFAIENNYILKENRTNLAHNSDYAIIDTKGGKIQTWVAWNIPRGQALRISVVQSPEVTDHRLRIIRDVIFSNETVPAKDAVYYKGWEGALMAIPNKNTQLQVPYHFNLQVTDPGAGDIVISLTDLVNPAGYTGFTTSIADPAQRQILKANITIYGVGGLDDDQFAIILRHEIGHALGLAYSDDPDDIMHLTISQHYISSCDVSAVASLYNGGEESQVSC